MANIYRVRAVGTGWSGAPGLMTFYYQALAAGTTAEATEAAARVRAYLDGMKTLMPNNISWDVLESVDFLDVATGGLTGGFTAANQSSIAGQGAGSTAPIASALLGKLLTGAIVAGRRLSGRTFFSPTIISSYDGSGVPTAAALVSFNNALAKLTTQIATPLSCVVWSRPFAGSTTVPARVGTIAVLTGTSASGKPGVLRSRRD